MPFRETPGLPEQPRSRLISVRWKLTAAFLAIALLFSLATLASDRGFRDLRQSLGDIHEQTLPRVLALQEVGIRVPDILRIAATVPAESDSERLAELKAALTVERNELDLAVAECGAMATDLYPLLVEIDRNLETLFDSQGQRIAALRRVSTGVNVLSTGSADLAGELERDLIDAQNEGLPGNAIRDMRIQLLSIAAELRAVPDAATEGQLAQIERSYELARRESVRYLTSLAKGRRELRATALRRVLLEPRDAGSLFALQRKVLGFGSAVGAIVQEGRSLGARLQGLAAGLAEESRAAIEVSRAAALGKSWRAHRIVLSLWLTALMLSALILWLYVQARVVRRMEQLSDDLTRLSQGDLEVEVRGGGDLEVAQIASVAEVFRQNARELKQTLRTLEMRNETLTEFAFVASHDLKSPMRAIANLAAWVCEDVEELIPLQSKEHLRLITERIEKMETLLEDLLRYSRLGNDEALVEELNLGEVLDDVVELMVLPEAVTVTSAGLDRRVSTIAAPLRLCLRNLLQNAHVHSDQAEPRILVTAASMDPAPDGTTFLAISVEDDGPGIPEGQRGEALRIFRKLDHGGPGTGMGLALAKRAVELMGGSISIEDADPRGLRVTLHWPGPSVQAPFAAAYAEGRITTLQ